MELPSNVCGTYETKFNGVKGGVGNMIQMECKNLCLCYNKKQVVNQLSFQVEQGDFLCIVGENGSGKSTLLKGILGLKKPEKGALIFHDGFSHTQMGYLPQQESGLEDFPATVKEIVQSGLLKSKPFGLFYTKKQKKKAGELMKTMEIDHLSNTSFGELSGGQKQRVLLARAFGAAEKMLILDEPLNGLDPLVAKSLYEAIEQKNKEGVTVIMVSHQVNQALSVANKILHLGNHTYFFGTVEQYKTSAVGQAFLKGEVSCG